MNDVNYFRSEGNSSVLNNYRSLIGHVINFGEHICRNRIYHKLFINL